MAEKSEEIATLKRSRIAHRSITKRLFVKFEDLEIEEVSESHKMEVIDELTSTIITLENKQETLKGLDDKIMPFIEDEDDLEKELETSTNFELVLQKHIARFRRLKKTLEQTHYRPISRTVEHNIDGVKLPKLQISIFKGDPLQWNSFKDTFTATIHNNKKLSAIEKFTYLQSYVEGDAQQAIEGLPLTKENYEKALTLLADRYGNPQLIRSSLMNKLIKLQKVANGSVKELRKLYDTIESNVRALKSTGIDKETLGPLLIPIVLEKLPNVIRLHLSRKLGSENWDIAEFLKAINEEIQARESFDFLKDSEHETKKLSKTHVSSLATGSKERKALCQFCGNEHYSDQCTIVTDQKARREILQKNHRCFNCLKSGHLKRNCSVIVKCFKCGMRGNHHTALCLNDEKKDAENLEKTTTLVDDSNTVLLQTANVVAKSDSRACGVRVLFDSGSQQTYITQKLAKELRLSPIRGVNMAIKTFGNENQKISFVQEYELSLNDVQIKAFAVPSICAPISGQNINIVLEKFPHLKNYVLADLDKSNEKHIDILIGADYYWRLVTGEVKKVEGGLRLVNSVFGYLLSGPVAVDIGNSASSSNLVSSHAMKITCDSRPDEQLTEEVKNFWNLETVGIGKSEKSVYERFEDEIDFADGRYVVKLPLKASQSTLPDNYLMSERRLKSLKSRLNRDKSLLQRYDDVFAEQLKAGIIEPVQSEGEPGMVTYLPHREVLREDKSSTKLRVVFDASAKQKDGISLNEILYKGPCLNPQLYDLLLKFRVHPVAITADIEKAYLQISIDPQHRDFLRFLWYQDAFANEPEIVRFRFARVIFGASCSQFLLNGVVRKIGEKFDKVDPEFSRKVREHFYIDDLNTGTSSGSQNGMKLYKQFKVRFAESSFNLRKWRTNDGELREMIDREEINNKTEISEKQYGKVLGITWNEFDDKLILSVKELFQSCNEQPTKRDILKVVASIYDPLGFLQPLTIRLKILFRELCLANVEWDKTLPQEFIDKWKILLEN